MTLKFKVWNDIENGESINWVILIWFLARILYKKNYNFLIIENNIKLLHIKI